MLEYCVSQVDGTPQKEPYPAGVARPPRFFVKVLESMWPDHYLAFNKFLLTWEIWKDLEVLEPDEHGRPEKRIVPICRAVFDYNGLNSAALDNLRYRRWVGLNFMKTQKDYLGWLRKDELESKRKKRDRNLAMIAEGLTWKRRMETTRTFS